MKQGLNCDWICTDPDTNQYGRKISNTVYEFKEDIKIDANLIETRQAIIDLKDYTPNEIEDIIISYGYSLLPWRDGNDILYDYGPDMNWLIAECIFETEIS